MSPSDKVPADKLSKFELSEDSLNSFRSNKSIPIDLYNKDGQVIMLKKKNPNEEDFGILLTFELQGVYCRTSENKLDKTNSSDHLGGKNVKLFDQEKTLNFAKQSTALLDELKRKPFSSEQAVSIQSSVNEILDDFTANPDFESGLLNILEILSVAGIPLQSELMTKRTIVAMGMKVRTKKIVADEEKKPNKKEHLAIMTASYLSDIGYTKLRLLDNPKLSKEEYLNIQQHPTISYLMTLPAPEISTEIRTLILNHHSPFRGTGINNNFPNPRTVFTKLMAIRDLFIKDLLKARLVTDIETQLRLQENNVTPSNHEEDVAILSLASEYASLTSNQSWRPAYSSAKALKIILNDSFFSYSNKNIRHLLDYVGASLTNNENIILVGEHIITAAIDSEKQVHFDVCKIIEVDRHQTRPKVQRICTIKPIFKKGNRYNIFDFDRNDIKMDLRKIVIDLGAQASSTQRIVYIVDHELNEPLYDMVTKLSKAS